MLSNIKVKGYKTISSMYTLTLTTIGPSFTNIFSRTGWLGSGRKKMAYDSLKTPLVELTPDRLGAIGEMEFILIGHQLSPIDPSHPFIE